MIEQDILEQCLKDFKQLNKILNERGDNDAKTYDIIHYEIKLISKYLKKIKDASVPTLNPDGTTFQPAFINMYDVAQLLAKHAEQRIKVAKQRNKDNGKERKTN